MKAGALDYLVKPVEETRLISSVRRAIELVEIHGEYAAFRARLFDDKLEHPGAFAEVITQSPAMTAVFHYLETVAPTPTPLLITGETGTGKKLLARITHQVSGAPGEFAAIDTTDLDDAAFTRTLFGRARRRFGNVGAAHSGTVERAEGGTVFLRELGDLSPESQAKLLRLIQEREYFPEEADFPKRASVRVIVGSSREPASLRRFGQLNPDLFNRLRAQHVHIPPLRQRQGDLPLLAGHFLREAAQAHGVKARPIPPGLCALLETCLFPGNIGQLKAMIYDVVGRAPAGRFTVEDFQAFLGDDASSCAGDSGTRIALHMCASAPELPTIQEITNALIEEALARTGQNQSHAAQLLGITQSALSQRLKRMRDSEAEPSK